MIKKYVMKKMLERQLKDVPTDQKEMIMQAVEDNPELFEKIGKEIQAETKKGRDQTAVTMEVFRKYQSELQKALKR